MRFIFLFIIFFRLLNVNAQKNYSELIKPAIKIINSEDSTEYKQAYKLIERAFKIFPDSINGTGLYFASMVNSSLKNYDKAFKYLTPLAKMEKDDEGYPGWSFVLDEYAEESYKNLMYDHRWEKLKKNARKDSLNFFRELQRRQEEFFATTNDKLNNDNYVYENIKKYTPYILKKERNYSISLKINDTSATSYLVRLPKNYNPKKKYPMLFFLHGAVRFSKLKKYQIPEITLGGWNRYYTKYGDLNEVVLVFPSANKNYNWMTSDKGFFMIPKIVKSIKSSININDNKVFIAGHSNGATGSFSYLIKQPILFAGFYGFNTQPKVYTGGTFIENVSNRSFINFSTDKDYYYPPNANDTLKHITNAMNLEYKEYRYKGFPHWFPEFDESEVAYQVLFNDLKQRERNPFPRKISWEFDDDKYGAVDWLTEIKLDTLQNKKSWHNKVNFKIDKWLKYNKNDDLVFKDVNVKAFDFPRESGKVIANYSNNVFQVKTSRIKSFTINISPEMVDLQKEIKVYVNTKLHFKGKLTLDNRFTLKNFRTNRDREQVWVNQIKLNLKN